MIWYKPQTINPNKHHAMPDAYPWCVSYAFDAEAIEISEIDYELIISSIDLSEYYRAIQIEQNQERQKSQREFGQYLVPELIDLMGARNLTLIQDGISINISSIASDNAGIKLLIETGALSTARQVANYYKIKYPHHEDIYTHVIDDITNFLMEKGYEI